MQIRVPASSANLGPGFDSIGVAVSLYLSVDVCEETASWQVEHQLGDLPHDETNMIVQTALSVVPTLHPHRLVVVSNIPVTHGLGSSSSAIVAGIELANQLANRGLTSEEKVEIASQLEGHPDNVAPAILGGLVVGTNVNGHFAAIKAPELPFDFVAYIPAYNLATKRARAALPQQLSYRQAIHASAVANTMVAGLFAKRYNTVGELMQADEFHEQYRQELVPELAKIRKIAAAHDAVATYLSGAGPTVMTLVKPTVTKEFVTALRHQGLTARLEVLHPDEQGLMVYP